MPQPLVPFSEVDKFWRVWTNNGVSILLTDIHKKFAHDFANVVASQLMSQFQQQMAMLQRPKAKVVATDT